jgi:transglutaminase-like putative cysteine protease
MQLSIRHRTVYRYAPATPAVTMRLKLFPGGSEAQAVTRWAVTLNGVAVKGDLRDSWGDQVATLFLRGAVEAVEIVAEGVVETIDMAGLLRGWREPMRPGVCLRETPHTRPDAAIRALAAEGAQGETPLARAHALMGAVREAIAYTPGSTGAATTAAAALGAGKGVCQDHAHVLIAAARSLGWPARYVTGYFLPGEGEAPDAATHAWAEIWIPGLGWVGFDASTGLCPTDAYVRLCAGLDAADAAPLRGHAAGVSTETMEAEVALAPLQAAAQAQQ